MTTLFAPFAAGKGKPAIWMTTAPNFKSNALNAVLILKRIK